MDKSFSAFLRVPKHTWLSLVVYMAVFMLYGVLLLKNSVQYALLSSVITSLAIVYLIRAYVFWGADGIVLLRIKLCLHIGYKWGYYVLHFATTLTIALVAGALMVVLYGNLSALSDVAKFLFGCVGLSMLWLYIMFRSNPLLDARLRPLKMLIGHSTLLVYDVAQKCFVPTTGNWYLSRTVQVKGQASIHFVLASAPNGSIIDAQPYMFKYVYY